MSIRDDITNRFDRVKDHLKRQIDFLQNNLAINLANGEIAQANLEREEIDAFNTGIQHLSKNE